MPKPDNQFHQSFSHVLCGSVALAALAIAQFAVADEFEFFEKRIRPVLADRCYQCHSASSEKLKGGLRLDTREGMLKGGESGKPAVVPRDAERSLLVEGIRYSNNDLQMPPKDRGERLSESQVSDFVTWINSGAPDPRTNAAAAAKSAGAPRPSRHWAFIPPAKPLLPTVRRTSWPATPIDRFILARLESTGLEPSPQADKRTLIRRATYDLTGLPPTPAEVDAFLKDASRDAYAKVVDRLLASPHYGERWGRYWLDVARYSDTKGYVYDREEKRFVHSHVYRDWVIHALNRDLPYDQFLIAQIAGDRLAAPDGDASAGPADSPLAAMGFLTVGRRFLGVQHDIIDDRIDVLTRGTMGLTVACARCHDHKYDPIPIEDYYSLYGVFNSCSEQTVALSKPRAGTTEGDAFAKGLGEREDKLKVTFEKKREALNARLRAKAGEYLAASLDVSKLPTEEFYTLAGPDDLNPVIVRQWDSFVFKTRGRRDPVFGPWHALRAIPERELAAKAEDVLSALDRSLPGSNAINPIVLAALTSPPPSSMREVAQRYGKVLAEVNTVVRAAETNGGNDSLSLTRNQEQIRQILYGPDSPAGVPHGAIVDVEWFFDEPTRVELAKLQADIERWIITAAGAPPHALILADRPAPKNARVFLRGNPANKGEEASRQFLGVVAGPDRKPFREGSGRLELARAIASRENPLTARVMVNRVWMQHFGAGLVRTASDFGARAEPPTHPELLDWLAVWFMDNGWSLKKLHRLIMLSAVYQQSSNAEGVGSSAKAFADAEEARVDGADHRAPSQIDPDNRLLSRMNKRRLDFEAMRDSLLAASGELDLTVGGKSEELFGKKPNRRRTVYGYIDRQFLPGVYRIFDFASPDLHIPQRSDTTVPQQALFFMNSPFLVERARALAGRPEVKNQTRPDERVRELYRTTFQREPTPSQLRAALAFIESAAPESAPEPRKPVPTQWRYGYGEFDTNTQRIKFFVPLSHFTGDAWQGGPNWPDEKLGWVQLTAEGGHAGNDLRHAAIRRWVAPRDGAITISGALKHEFPPGDGINARIVSSRAGVLGTWTVHKQSVDAKAGRTEVKAGDTIDFVVDFRANLNSDMFRWAPVIRLLESTVTGEGLEWSARKEFTGPLPPPPEPLSGLEKYAQVLLESNEFLFVD